MTFVRIFKLLWPTHHRKDFIKNIYYVIRFWRQSNWICLVKFLAFDLFLRQVFVPVNKQKNIEGLYIILSRINSISTSYNPILLTFGLLTTLVLLTTLLFVNLRNYRPALFFGPIKVSPKNIGFHHHFTCQ